MSLITFIGGFLSSFLGLGGSSFYNPIMIALGTHPQIANATGMYIVLINAITT